MQIYNEVKLSKRSLPESVAAFADKFQTGYDEPLLHTMKGELDPYQVFTPEQIDALVALYPVGVPTATNWTPSWTPAWQSM